MGRYLQSEVSVFIYLFIQGYQHVAIPENGKYKIEAKGAASCPQTFQTGTGADRFGRGAMISGEWMYFLFDFNEGVFEFKKGDVLTMLVGQTPIQSDFNGGGGGTFVTLGPDRATSTLLIAAGGGGSYRVGFDGPNDWQQKLDGSTGENGVSVAHSGGTGGSGGKSHGTYGHGAGGAGFSGNGLAPSYDGYVAAEAFRNGGKGGTFACNGQQDGGFGGGGAGGWGGSGGGGGFSGGGAGNEGHGDAALGGGGGSFNSGENKKAETGWSEDGQITITFVGK